MTGDRHWSRRINDPFATPPIWKYDPDAEAGYVTIRRGDVMRTRTLVEGVNADFGEHGMLLGIEILSGQYPPFKMERLSVTLAAEHTENGHHGRYSAYCYRCQYFQLHEMLTMSRGDKLAGWLTFLISFGRRSLAMPNTEGQHDRDINHRCGNSCSEEIP